MVCLECGGCAARNATSGCMGDCDKLSNGTTVSTETAMRLRSLRGELSRITGQPRSLLASLFSTTTHAQGQAKGASGSVARALQAEESEMSTEATMAVGSSNATTTTTEAPNLTCEKWCTETAEQIRDTGADPCFDCGGCPASLFTTHAGNCLGILALEKTTPAPEMQCAEACKTAGGCDQIAADSLVGDNYCTTCGACDAGDASNLCHQQNCMDAQQAKEKASGMEAVLASNVCDWRFNPGACCHEDNLDACSREEFENLLSDEFKNTFAYDELKMSNNGEYRLEVRLAKQACIYRDNVAPFAPCDSDCADRAGGVCPDVVANKTKGNRNFCRKQTHHHNGEIRTYEYDGKTYTDASKDGTRMTSGCPAGPEEPHDPQGLCDRDCGDALDIVSCISSVKCPAEGLCEMVFVGPNDPLLEDPDHKANTTVCEHLPYAQQLNRRGINSLKKVNPDNLVDMMLVLPYVSPASATQLHYPSDPKDKAFQMCDTTVVSS